MTHETESSVARLVRLAGEPDLPSAEGTRRARAASEQAWRRMLAETGTRPARRGPVLALGLGLAAVLAIGAWFVGQRLDQAAPVMVVGRVVTLQGTAMTHRAEVTTPLTMESALFTGTTVETRQGRLAATLGTTLSLRLDQNTRLEILGDEQVRLVAGSLYVDSGGINSTSPLRILTPAGDVRHVGTQFQVSVSGRFTRVQVREGRVLLGAAAATRMLTAGDVLDVRGDEFRLQRELPAFGEDWSWAAALAPALEIENRPLAEFLAWLVREQGWRLHFASAELQEQAAQIRLHGSLEGLSVDGMLERVSLVTGLRLEVRHGVLWVGA